MKKICLIMFSFTSLVSGQLFSANSIVPDPFQGFDDDSKYMINYDDLSALLDIAVVDVGRSSRSVAEPPKGKTGTLMKTKVKRTTGDEANRFYFETFEDNENGRQILKTIKASLEQLPAEVALKFFSRDEQLAYWLNLYNVTVLNELIDLYPKTNLKKYLVGKKSILSKPLLSVSGIPLSLNDIQFTILKNNYDNPLVMYGLYQGNIGGPNIRKSAYEGRDVWRALKNNALEFVNSNRGTYGDDKKTDVFKVSSLYDRNRIYFPDFNDNLAAHLMEYLEGQERTQLSFADTVKPGIDDWSITSLSGRYREFGGSLASSKAALLDSVGSTNIDTNKNPAGFTAGGPVLGASVGHGSSSTVSKSLVYNRIDPELLEHLIEINEKRKATNAINSSVTLEELGVAPVQSGNEATDEKNNQE